MNKRGSADKIKLSSFDDLFGTQEAGTGTEQVQEIPLCELHEFRGHPFKVVDDEKMQETVESIKNYGVLMPVLQDREQKAAMKSLPGTVEDMAVNWLDCLQCRCLSEITRMMKPQSSW